MRDRRGDLPNPIRLATLIQMDDTLTSLRSIVGRHAGARYRPSTIPHVALYKDGAAPQPMSGVYQPMVALIVSGAKEIVIGDRRSASALRSRQLLHRHGRAACFWMRQATDRMNGTWRSAST